MSSNAEARSTQPKEVNFWLHNDAGQTTASTSLHADFLSVMATRRGLILDVGCGNGRVSRKLAQTGNRVVGVDPNIQELTYGKGLDNEQPNISYVQGYGDKLPFRDEQFDTVVMLAVLGAVGKCLRENILTDTIRCLKPSGLIYLAEFARITDPLAKTSKGQLWQKKYVEDIEQTGEDGSIIVRNLDGSTKFIGHHFRQEELLQPLKENNIKSVRCETVQVQSKVSGLMRDNLNIWGYK